MLSETQAYHRDHPQVSEKIVSTLTITGATTAEPRVRYRMDSSTTHTQKKGSHNVILLELHLRSKGDGSWEIVRENELERQKLITPDNAPPPLVRAAQPLAKPAGKPTQVDDTTARQAIMDVMRLDFYDGDAEAAHRNLKAILFKVIFLKIHGDWACTCVDPTNAAGNQVSADMSIPGACGTAGQSYHTTHEHLRRSP